ncbi:DUF4843 domain-containing protein [Bacteroides sp. 224]|uniref:DUF4843 domain-containing protein n=1 Tax=Bacteroides sp. 224 TaxID=2302936 RepID=UPI0013CFFE07|nr:DUF4843 domain-containing protein [Bacteroides sp. 224]NDV64619.1 DUF4843 domain-containing protein [Bacteroides sp. 224]
MKKNSLKWWVCAFLLQGIGWASCADEDLITYEDVPRIYFKYADAVPSSLGDSDDQIIINMGYDNPVKNDTIIRIPLKLMGKISEKDRVAKVVLIPEESTATEGEDIEILSAYLPAGSVYGIVEVKLNRTKAVDKEMLLARIRLASNENFHTDYSKVLDDKHGVKNGLIYSIYFTALADKPGLWAASYSSMPLNGMFGPYSKVKLDAICEACGLTREFFELDPDDNDPTGEKTFDKRFPTEMTYGLIALTNRYLAQYKKDHDGKALLDEFGSEVKMGMNIQ